jgi:hypothetical protein
MSTAYPYVPGPVAGRHPAVVGRRARERLLILLGGLVPLLLALGISLAMPKPNSVAIVGILLGAAIVVALIVSTRYTVTLTFLALYLGLLDGPIKLESASQAASTVRDVLISAIALGMILRLLAKRESVTMPPLSRWVLAFVAVVVIEAVNPNTHGLLKILGGYRQELEWVPFFFFAYLMMRDRQRFRQLFLILGVIALANGVVGAVQARLSPTQLASWGPGYSERITGNSGAEQTGRTYSVEGVSHPRPPALGSDAGFGGGVGVIALPGLLALLAVGRLRRRWPVLLLCLGALLGIATAASRTSIVIAGVTLLVFAGLSVIAGLRVSRPLMGLAVVAVLAFVVASALEAADGNAIFARQESLSSVSSAEESGGDAKEKHLSQIPGDILHDPFGLGLATAGSAGGFGGHQSLSVEEQQVSGGSAYNLLTVELGAPGLLLWIGLTVNVLVLAIRRLRRIADPELRTYLVAVLTAFIALTVQGFAGTTLAVSPAGIYLWFVPGVIAYWFAGPGRRAMTKNRAMTRGPAIAS